MVGEEKVRRILHTDNLLAVRRRKFVVTTDSKHRFRVHPNLAEALELTALDQLWVADITYIRLQREFVFLAVVLDAFSRKAIGWELGRTLETKLALAALEAAIAGRHPQPGLVHHSDRGTQYASNEYVQRLEALGAHLSMSRAASLPSCGSTWMNSWSRSTTRSVCTRPRAIARRRSSSSRKYPK